MKFPYFLIVGIFFGILLLSNSFPLLVNAQICRGSDTNDIDGDSIPNDWEVNGADVDNNGVRELDLAALGFNPLHKDIFLEVDYMENRRPIQKALNNVISQFDHAPLCNPDGITGISLHIEVDDEVPHVEVIDIPTLRHIKSEYLGTDLDRNSSNYDDIVAGKDKIFYYGLFADKYPGGYSGVADGIPFVMDPARKSFMVTLGEFTRDPTTNLRVGNVDEQSGTLMHELGHSLGLSHGGKDHSRYKPNYLSVMNYAFQFSSILANRSLDYSRCEIGGLDERNLAEASGIGISCPPGLWTIVYANDLRSPGLCEERARLMPTGSQIDWNNDGYVNATDTRRDLNCDGQFESLDSNDDWNNLVFPLDYDLNSAGESAGLTSGNDSVVKEIPELTIADVQYHESLLVNDSKDAVKNIIVPERQARSGSGGAGVEGINITNIEIVKNNSLDTLGTPNSFEPSMETEVHLSFTNNTSILAIANETNFLAIDAEDDGDNSTVSEAISTGETDVAISKLEDIQNDIDSAFANVSDDARDLIGETEAQQKLENLKQVLEGQQWK